jgi:hypothetical protein
MVAVWSEWKMKFDDRTWRPITFQGMEFPVSLMAISVLGPILDVADPELADWLWHFPICCGLAQSAPAEICARCARQCVELMEENRRHVLDGIRTRLAANGFDPQTTYLEWLYALQRIAQISAKTAGDCFWSAPINPGDPLQSAADMTRFLDNFENVFAHHVYA